MKSAPRHAGVYIQPPIFGVIVFLLAILLQHWFTISGRPSEYVVLKIIAGVLILIGVIFGLTGVYRFFKAGTTVETFKPVTALQTTGIYRISRNPMYAGLASIYLAISLLFGNWWTVIMTPLFILILNKYLIPHEENYLKTAFGDQYLNYLRTVNRWIGRKNKP